MDSVAKLYVPVIAKACDLLLEIRLDIAIKATFIEHKRRSMVHRLFRIPKKGEGLDYSHHRQE